MMVATLGMTQTVSIGGLKYTLSSSTWTATVAMYYNVSGAVVIPDSVVYSGNTYIVTSIGNRAFYYCGGLTSVTIGNSVTSIGDWAFYDCSGLTSVTIGNSVTSIGNNAFSGCSGLTSVTIPNSVTSIGSYAFRGCSGLTSVTIGNSVTSIGDYAFYYCSGLTSVTIPNSVTNIGLGAFADCSGLTSVTIPDSVTSIGYYAFSACSGLTSITVSSGNTVYDSRNNCNAIIETATNTLFSGCQNTTIPNSVTSIGWDAFSGCSGLTSVTIPNSVTSIGYSAFLDCTGLTSVTIPNSVTSIGNHAFAGCSGLTSITIPNSVTSISYEAFADCSGLTSVTIPNSVTSIGGFAFAGCSGLTSITIPNSVTSIGGYAFYGCSGLTSITIPNSVTSIGYYAFSGCSGLDSIVMLPLVPPFGTNDSLFYGNNALCYVRCGALAAYQAAAPDSSARFVEMDFEGNLTLAVNDSLYGSAEIIPQNGQAVQCSDLSAVIQATAAPHYHFDHWSNGRTANPDTLYLEGDSTVTAFFAIDTHMVSVTLNDEAMGSVVGAGAYPYSTEVSLEAVPEEGYRFVRWGDGSADNPAVFTLTGDTTVSAIFEEVEIPSICKVSVQDDRNVVFWIREHEVEQYRLYREGAVAGDYELVATVPYSEPSVWTDEESRPGERRYSYKMTVVDAQGNESPFSEEHKTMHLTIGQGTGNQWNLTWPEYRGAELESYMIYRGTEENDLQLIGQLPAGGPMSYIDEAAPAGTVYYQVAAVMSSPCDIAGIDPLIRSNIAVGEGEDSVGVRDVQAGNLQVWNAGGHIHVSLDGHEVAEYRVYDAIGREVYHATREARTPALPGGVYLVKVAGHPAHKVVVLR